MQINSDNHNLCANIIYSLTMQHIQNFNKTYCTQIENVWDSQQEAAELTRLAGLCLEGFKL